jgi:hypothetical protein
MTTIRGRWAAIANEHLAEHGHAARIDHRTLEAQGVLDREPTYHKGPAVTAIERRGEATRVTERVREDVGERLQLAAERGRLERESNELARSIIDAESRDHGPRDGARPIINRNPSATHTAVDDGRRPPGRPDAVAGIDRGAGQGGTADGAGAPDVSDRSHRVRRCGDRVAHYSG